MLGSGGGRKSGGGGGSGGSGGAAAPPPPAANIPAKHASPKLGGMLGGGGRVARGEGRGKPLATNAAAKVETADNYPPLVPDNVGSLFSVRILSFRRD